MRQVGVRGCPSEPGQMRSCYYSPGSLLPAGRRSLYVPVTRQQPASPFLLPPRYPALQSVVPHGSPSQLVMPTLQPEAQPNMAPLLPISCPSVSGSSFTLQLSWGLIWASCGPSPEAALRGSTIPERWGLPKDSSAFCVTASTACFKTWAVI